MRLSCLPSLAAALLLAGCAATSATVVGDSGTAPTISQAQAAPYKGPQKRIAVSAFDNRAGDLGVGRGMSDMLTAALFNTGRFIVLERDQLGEVMAEQDRAASDRFKKETAAPKGELEGAELLIRGSITHFEPNCQGGSAILVSAKQACLGINLRILDAATGRVLNATTVDATSADNRIGIIWTRGTALPIGLGTYSNTPMEVAIRNAIETAVAHIVATKL